MDDVTPVYDRPPPYAPVACADAWNDLRYLCTHCVPTCRVWPHYRYKGENSLYEC